MTKTTIKYDDVDIWKPPYFLVSYTEECGGADWEPIAVLSIEKEVEDMRLQLLVHNVRFKSAIDRMQTVLHNFLRESNNPRPISFLIYFCSTFSNCYGHTHFTYVEKIGGSNLLYFVLTDSKLRCHYNNVAVSTLHNRLTEVVINDLFAVALDAGPQYDADQYNKDLSYLYGLLIKELPISQGFQLQDIPTLIEFSESIAKLSTMDFCNLLYYLKKIKLIKNGKKIDGFLGFYRKNQKMHEMK